MKIAVILVLASAGLGLAADRTDRELERSFQETIYPFLETYCFSCHGAGKQKAKLDLRIYSTREAIVRNHRQWEVVLEKLKASEMPPEEAKKKPAAELRQQILVWSRALRKHEAQRQAGDPGPGPGHRLSNAEYDHTIRDLTGVDLRPAREFPVDPANEAGFDNSGESLAMSPSLLNKYLEAARQVAEHLVLKPDGFAFAPHPMVTESDRDKYCVKRIIDFYQRQPTNYADYFLTAWRFQHRARLGQPKATLAAIAATNRVSPKYAATVWSFLTGPPESLGPLAALQKLWHDLPVPAGPQPDLARPGCDRMSDFVASARQLLKPEVTNLTVRGIAPGSQPFVLWKDRQLAANHRRFDPATWSAGKLTTTNEALGPLPPQPVEPAARARSEAALERFCRLFPDAFHVSERVLVFLKEDKESRGRLLSAGFHLMTGYFRDDAPLCDLVLDEPARRQLDQLWDEFHFITHDFERQYKDFIFFERAEPPRFMQGAEFDFARSEDKEATSAAKMDQLAKAYLAKARRQGAGEIARQAIEDYFRALSAEIRRIEQARLEAEPSQLQTLLGFAERAYRRPLTTQEQAGLLAFYRRLRVQEALDHEEALRDTVASVLMSPHFCYRGLVSGSGGPQGPDPRTPSAASPNQPMLNPAAPAEKWKREPLSDYALASRLSYFLWSSMPDSELMACARAGTLRRRSVLLAQTRRMLQNEHVRGFVTEFGGHWLDFRRFEEHNAVDRGRFPTFNNELRQAMFEEPIQFFLDLIRQDRSVLEFLYANHTFVNPILARHYGVTFPGAAVPATDVWMRVDQAGRYGRGGLLTMSVFLTQNAPGLRTSPVKRGYWIIRRLLGEQIPPPPPDVPELPAEEAKLGELTLREMLARHREDKSCAGCHARFDSFGLVFEGYGPIGEQRTTDLGGRPVDVRATFPGGGEGAGVEGLRRYLHEAREPEFLDNLCRKLLAYALGRSLMLSDDLLVEAMRMKLAANGYRLSNLVETIVTSPQFLTQRERATPGKL